MNYKILVIKTLCFFVFFQAKAQEDVIKIKNPSFEGKPTPGQKNLSFQLADWDDCGPTDRTPPDIQPNAGFNVTRPAFDGNTYLAMVVREDGTYESVGQKLDGVIRAGVCYAIAVMLCKTNDFISIVPRDGIQEVFKTPVKLRIWGGNSRCDRAELLAESDVVSNTNWQDYILYFVAEEDYTYITLEAYYESGEPYNGNLLLDDMSDIKVMTCK